MIFCRSAFYAAVITALSLEPNNLAEKTLKKCWRVFLALRPLAASTREGRLFATMEAAFMEGGKCIWEVGGHLEDHRRLIDLPKVRRDIEAFRYEGPHMPTAESLNALYDFDQDGR
jgi:hypothetical protein